MIPVSTVWGCAGHLVELSVVDEVGSVSVNQSTEGQAILPASPANEQRESEVRVQKDYTGLNTTLSQHSLHQGHSH